MATPRNVCHRCRHKWKVKKGLAKSCPKCGCDNVGPTDPAGGLLPKLVVVVLLAGGVAWWLGLLPGEAQDVVDDAVDDVRREVESRTGDGGGGGATGEAGAGGATGAAGAGQGAADGGEEAAAGGEDPAAAAKAAGRPLVVVASRMGTRVGPTYLVRGRIANQGGADARDVRVVVTLLDDEGAEVDEVEAKAPTEVAEGGDAAYEAAVADEDERVADFRVRTVYDSDGA